MRPGIVGRSSKLAANSKNTCSKCYRASRQYSQPAVDENNSQNGRTLSRKQQQKMLDRDFFLSVFSASATKRDAKAYLSKYKEQEKLQKAENDKRKTRKEESERTARLQKSGVNLGGLYGQARAIEMSPKFAQYNMPDQFPTESSGPINAAVVKLRGIDELGPETRRGVALTLVQLSRLGLLSCVVIEGSSSMDVQSPNERRKALVKHCFRLAKAINAQSKTGGARVLDQTLSVYDAIPMDRSSVPVQGSVFVETHEHLLHTLQRGFIPIIPPIAFTSSLKAELVDADDAVLALTRELSGITRLGEQRAQSGEAKTSLDKIIVLDPLGGLPAVSQPDQSHIFVNLEQEFEPVRLELQQLHNALLTQWPVGPHAFSHADTKQGAGGIEPIDRHTKNLELMKRCLSLLPPTSSALLTTPSEAASSALFSTLSQGIDASGPGVGTRSKRNPLIHNLLTDKPVISSSLPSSRVVVPSSEDTPSSTITKFTPATFFKRGMPLTIVPDPKIAPWTPPGAEGSSLRLESDPRIDFPRLLNLIEDSFGRPLDAQHYLDRIKGQIAGVIVAGEYEGGAILTWESPGHGRPPVPYLDKFAVLRRSQGSGGVADIVFNAMVRTCLPDGVVWRSRKNNPVNKWYFERSVGTWKLPDSQWCMFWTGEDVDFGRNDLGGQDAAKKERWKDYVNVCSSIEASWADRDSKPPD